MSRLGAAALALLTLVACGGGIQGHFSAFSTNWEDDGGVTIGRVWDRIGSALIPPAADIVVGVAGNTDKLIGMPLGGGPKWTFAHPLDVRPVVAGDVVVGSGGGETFALIAKTGEPLWRRATGGLPMLGAGDGGTVTVVTFGKADDTGSVLLAVTHDGQVVQQIETDRRLGSPAVLGRLAFVPWAGLYVSVLDLASGSETARVTLREETSRAWTEGGALWFGQIGTIRFDTNIRYASRNKATMLELPRRKLPGTPILMPSGSTRLSPVANAEDKVHLYARPDATGGSGAVIADDRWYATYFRVVMGFDAAKGQLAWTRLGAADFVGGAAGDGGVVLCDEQGKVVELDAKTGGTVLQADLGEPVRSCVVNVDGLRPTAAPTDTKPLASQLAEVVTSDDLRLVVAQKLLLGELAASNSDVGTQALVELASDPRTSPDILVDARTALANRRTGASFMEAALARRYDFLKDVLRAPPVGPIAQALGAMKEASAAPLLATHLLDPADTDDDVRQAAAALAVVAGPAQLPALREFFGMYRATAPNDDIAAAVASVGEALVRLGDVARVAAAASDGATVPYARERLQTIVAALPAQAPRTK